MWVRAARLCPQAGRSVHRLWRRPWYYRSGQVRFITRPSVSEFTTLEATCRELRLSLRVDFTVIQPYIKGLHYDDEIEEGRAGWAARQPEEREAALLPVRQRSMTTLSKASDSESLRALALATFA